MGDVRRADRRRRALVVAASVGLVHAGVSVYWGLGGSWLLETLGERIVSTFVDLRWLLLVVALVKATAALAPWWLDRRGLLERRPWRWLTWGVASILVIWGGLYTVVGNLVLTGVIDPADGYDRSAMIGHARLWDPLFLVWGLALALALVTPTTSAGGGTRHTRRIPAGHR